MSPLRKKLEELISSDKDHFPNSLTLIKSERDKILQTVESYKESIITANIEYKVCQDILNHRPDLAFQKIIKRLHELKDDAQMTCLYSLGEICMLKATMMIKNAVTSKGSFKSAIVTLLLSLIQAFQTVYTDYSSLFYKQVILNLNATLAIARSKIISDVKHFENFVQVLQTKNWSKVKIHKFLLPQYGEELEESINNICNIDFFDKWNDAFLTDNIQFKLAVLLDELMDKEKPIFQIHRRFTENREKVLPSKDCLETKRNEALILRNSENKLRTKENT